MQCSPETQTNERLVSIDMIEKDVVYENEEDRDGMEETNILKAIDAYTKSFNDESEQNGSIDANSSQFLETAIS
ncbi:hypothetical protein V3C99_014216 [Haemonchus contortus]